MVSQTVLDFWGEFFSEIGEKNFIILEGEWYPYSALQIYKWVPWILQRKKDFNHKQMYVLKGLSTFQNINFRDIKMKN